MAFRQTRKRRRIFELVLSDGDDVTDAVVPNRLCFFFSSLPPFTDVVGALSSLVVRVSSSKEVAVLIQLLSLHLQGREKREEKKNAIASLSLFAIINIRLVKMRT